MKLRYYADTDSLYIELSDKPSADSREVVPGIVMDFDAEKQLVGIDIQKAKKQANLSDLDQVLLSEPDDLTAEEREELRSGLKDFESGYWVKWHDIRRADV